MSKHVAVLMGGWSNEREVSLVSGAACVQALEAAGYRVTGIDVARDLPALLAALEPRPDVIFNALHGRGGEDGVIQGVLDMLGVPYTHSGLLASAVAMDKNVAKQVFKDAGIPVPPGVVLAGDAVLRDVPYPAPFVLKPNNGGSSLGIHIVRPGDNRLGEELADEALGEEVLVEPFIPGHELTVAVMGDRALAVTEIQPTVGFYDYAAKYTEGRAQHLIPAPIPAEVYQACLAHALAAHRALGCAGVSRADFRWDDSRPGTDGLFMLEVNTQPGMTPLSLVPEQAAHFGIDFPALCAWIVEAASCHA